MSVVQKAPINPRAPFRPDDLRRAWKRFQEGLAGALPTGGEGSDKAGNNYADPTKIYPEKARYREVNRKRMH
jgi:hypothetical protein